MSKKDNCGTPNTLFKYFARSPASVVKKTPNVENGKERETTLPSAAKKLKLESPRTENLVPKAAKRELNGSSSSKENDSEAEDIKGNIKKRRRILAAFDSDSENEEDKSFKPLSEDDNSDDAGSPVVEKKTKKAPSKKNLLNDSKASQSFKEKLDSMKCDTSSKNVDVDIDEPSTTSRIDEPVVWPHNKLEFLKPDKIKDKKGRRPDHPDYDPTTLHVPEKFLSGLSPGVRQWWDLKSEHFDCVLFFKVGKFYELYHMDADVGVKELGFTYMRGEFAHSGFPEVGYDKMSTKLIERGYKVARVEQTETPDMMSERVKKQKTVTKFDRVVRREICQITNKGTQVYNSQCKITYNHQPNYMLAIAEKDNGFASEYGVCFIDTSIGDFFIGQFTDDKNCSRLLTLLSHYSPVLVLNEKAGTSARTQQIFRSVLSNAIKESLSNEIHFWGAEKTLKFLAENYFSNNCEKEWPKVLTLMQDECDHLGLTPRGDASLGLKSLGACIFYLKRCRLDEQVLSMCRYNLYTPPDLLKASGQIINVEKNEEKDGKKFYRNNMVLDSITLMNLRVTGEDYTLQSTLDNCCTKFGKRLLHYWICSPSCIAEEIRDRQEAIAEFLINPQILQDMRALFNNLPDFERHLAQIQGFGNGKRLKNHPDGRAILFEEKSYNKKKIQDFIAILRGFESLLQIPEIFSGFKSKLIVKLSQHSPDGMYPNMNEVLEFFKKAFDHDEALKEGVIAPEKGVDAEYDEAEEGIRTVQKELQNYLIAQEKYFGCRLAYFGNDKKRFQLEVPESYARKAGSDYHLEGQKKGSKPVRRFHTTETRDLLKRMMQAEEQRNNVLKDLSRRIFEKFSNHYEIWKSCVISVAILDVLGSLAEYTKTISESCIPEIVENVDKPFIEIEDGYHPCMTSAGNYIPNGITLGKDKNAPLALLTGPNMGGKSTLMRQVGLLAIMAQMGCHIPAKSCRMSLIDRIFTRLGAQDDIMAGHSTFLVELNETSSILKHTSVHSLVLLDELGRGTATYDGTAIAASVVDFLAEVKCRTLFSTHYHSLVDYFQNDDRISLGHMACMVENEDIEDPTQETVTFLYKYSAGACPKSYGFNAAKLAGMSHGIIKRAYELSKKVEATALKRKVVSKILEKEDLSLIKDLLLKIKSCNIK